MLSKGDDFPLHQNPEPIAYAGPSRNFYDRYFFNGYHKETDLFFALGMGIYPQLDIIDAGFSFIVDGVQHNLLSSRPLQHERLNTQVEGISVEVLQPLTKLKLNISSAAHGLKAELVFTGSARALEEPRFTRRIGSQIMLDYTRLTQNGSWEGWIEHKGHRFAVTPEDWLGTRDRSWGIRPVGMADPQRNPSAPELPQFYWLWAPINWPAGVSFYLLNDDAEGMPWNTAGVYAPHAVSHHDDLVDAPEDAEHMAQVASHIEFLPGTRYAKAARLQFIRRGGGSAQIDMQPRFHFLMKGVGYGHDHFAHGINHGGAAQTYEELKLADVDPKTNLHIQAICTAKLHGDLGEAEGHGVLEQLIIGPHRPSGFTELLDMAQAND